MSIFTPVRHSVKSRLRKSAPARPTLTLTLTIDGVAFDLRAFDFIPGAEDSGEVHVSLRGPDGVRFHVTNESDPGRAVGTYSSGYCERCDARGYGACRHIAAVEAVGLFG